MNKQNDTRLSLETVSKGALFALGAVLRGRRRFELTDKIALVTGGSRGLGFYLAEELLREGATVVICARDRAELARAEADLARFGDRVLAVPCDLLDREQVDRMLDLVQDQLGPIDVLVNNAGMTHVGPMEAMSLGDYEEAMRVHFWAPLYLTLAVLPDMQRNKAGRIVNISSVAGKMSLPHLLPYDASKSALTGLSQGLHTELAKDGIVVTTVCPGIIRTGDSPDTVIKGRRRPEYDWFSPMEAPALFSMGVRPAARRIVSALVRGESEVVLTLSARLATAVDGLMPGFTSTVFALANEYLEQRTHGRTRAEERAERRAKSESAERETRRRPRVTRPDDRLREEIRERLGLEPLLAGSGIDVEVRSGQVMLRGFVHDRATKRLAEARVESVPGVLDVESQLRIHGEAIRPEVEAMGQQRPPMPMA